MLPGGPAAPVLARQLAARHGPGVTEGIGCAAGIRALEPPGVVLDERLVAVVETPAAVRAGAALARRARTQPLVEFLGVCHGAQYEERV